MFYLCKNKQSFFDNSQVKGLQEIQETLKSLYFIPYFQLYCLLVIFSIKYMTADKSNNINVYSK